MTSLSNQDDFIADDFIPEEQDDFVQDDFVPEEPNKKKLEDLNWFEQHFTKEGMKLQSERKLNLLKGVTSGLTFGFSEANPNFKVSEEGPEGTAGKAVGSLLPLSLAAKAIGTPLAAVANLSPKFVKPLQSLAGLLGLSAAGGLYEGLEESAEKSIEANEFIPPDPKTILEQGGKWAALDLALRVAGYGGRFAKALWQKAEKAKSPVTEVFNDIIKKLGGSSDPKKALALVEDKSLKQVEQELGDIQKTKDVSQRSLQQQVQEKSQDLRSKKVSAEDFSKLAGVEVKPYLPGEFSAEEIAEKAMSEDLSARIEGVAPKAETERQLGMTIQEDIENSILTHKAETDALYDIAKVGEETKFPKVKETAESIVDQLKKLEGDQLNLTPEGYNKVKKQLRDTLTDLGYGLELDEAGKIVRAVESQRQPLSKVIEIKKRLNNIINYELLETGAQDFLKDPVAKLRGEIRKGYGPKSSKARKAFEKAEEKFGEYAEKRGKKSIKAIRLSEKPEAIARTIRTPSGLEDVKEMVSPEVFAQVERELLERMKDMSEKSANDFYRQIRPGLTDETRAIAEEILEFKKPDIKTRKELFREATQRKVLDDIANSTVTGTRPNFALDTWKTEEGQKLIKNALENNPNKAEVLKYLQEQSFKDFASSVVSPEGVVDFKKLNNLLKDKATANNIKLVAGEEGVTFLKQLETLSDRVKKNVSLIEGKIDKASASERNKIERELKSRGKEKLQKIKEKNIGAKEAEELLKQEAKEKQQELIKGKIDVGSAKERKAAEKVMIERRKEKFQTQKQKNQAKQKQGVLFKIDDLLNSYGVKAKGLITALGILNIGTAEAITAAASYEVLMRLAKNKNVQQAFKKAALPGKSPVELVRSITGLMDELEKSNP